MVEDWGPVVPLQKQLNAIWQVTVLPHKLATPPTKG